MLNLDSNGKMVEVAEYDYNQDYVPKQIPTSDEYNDVLIHDEKQICSQEAKIIKFENAMKALNKKNIKNANNEIAKRNKENELVSKQVDSELNNLISLENDFCVRLAVAQGQGACFNPDTATLGPITDYPQIVSGEPFNYNGGNMHGGNRPQMGDFWSDLWDTGTAQLEAEAQKALEKEITKYAETLLPGQTPPPGSTVVYQTVPVTQPTTVKPPTSLAASTGLIPGVSNKTLMIAGGGFAVLLVLIMVLKR